MSRRVHSLEDTYFDSLYGQDADPWRFATSPYEAEKYATTLNALPERHFPEALEVGCSIGIFSRALAARCGHLLALDVAEAALEQARQNCPLPNVTFLRRRVPEWWPAEKFDLIVLSEVLYYLDANDVASVAAHVRASLKQDGIVALVHYLGETDYPLTGDEAAEHFIAIAGLRLGNQTCTNEYRLDVLEGHF